MPGIYIHWPFCVKKCAYCAFASITDLSLRGAYLEALLAEIRAAKGAVPGCADTVFFGGGTPSVSSPEVPGILLDAVDASFGIAEDAEITMEANPGTVTKEHLAAWHRAGVNRLSLGLQAAQDTLLSRIGRIASSADFLRVFRAARDAGFENISTDLIYGLPGQTMEDWEDTLRFVLRVVPEHISAYALTLEEGTPLFLGVREGKEELPDEDLQAAMYERAVELLRSAGFVHYEISNFARPGRECRHNLKYWMLEEYLGFGCAAHSLCGHFRFAHTDSVMDYIVGRPSSHVLGTRSAQRSAEDAEEEFLMLRTRLATGFHVREYARAFGKSFASARQAGVRACIREDLAVFDGERFVPTLRGFLFQNRMVLHLVTG